ncbi:MAG: TRAP transporter small permease [Lautropia sp.]|nr:TRAP transporter small permease [Lautropia sp.]
MPRLLASICRLPDIVAAALLALVTLLVSAQVLVRYALGGSLVWSEELTRLLFVWMVLIAATTAAPMRVDLFVDMLSPRLRALTRLLAEAVVFGLILVLMYGAWGMMDLTQFDTYTALGISVRWLYLALFVSSALWILRSLATLGRSLRDLVA